MENKIDFLAVAGSHKLIELAHYYSAKHRGTKRLLVKVLIPDGIVEYMVVAKDVDLTTFPHLREAVDFYNDIFKEGTQ